MTHNVLPTMIENRQGVIINISSVSGIYGTAGQANYGAAKAGILLFSSALSKEVAGKNIRVNAVAPGFIETDMTKALTEEFCKKKLKEIPMKRFGKAEEIAKVVIFLASNDASYISGQTIVVDGGLT
ncbi:hypothetical protein CG709_07310 [Lachnotalea glycerini]|nr:hypothetical protein CG709_07310 [Lachnotalea glycerini]